MPLPPPPPRSDRHRSSAASATKAGAVAEAVETTLREWFQQATGGHQHFPDGAATPAAGAEAIVDAVLQHHSALAAGPGHSRRLSASLESTASNATDAPSPATAAGSAATACERDPLRDLVARLLVLTSPPAVAANPASPATVSVAPPSERSGRATRGNGDDGPAVVRRASPNPTNASAAVATVVRRDPVRLGPVADSKRRTIGSGGIRPTALAGRLRPAVSAARAAAPAGDATGENRRRSPGRADPTDIKTGNATTVAHTATGPAVNNDAIEASPRSIAKSSPDVLHPMRTTSSVPGQVLPPAAVSPEAWAPVALSEDVHCGRAADDDGDDDDDDRESLSHGSQDDASHDVPVTRHADTRGGSSDDDGGNDGGSSGDEEIVSELNQFVLLERLGRGSQGEVFLAMDTTSSELRAVKAVLRPAQGQRVSAAWQRKLDDLAREVAIMTRLRHRNIVTLHEVIDDPGRDKMYLVLQYIDGGPVAKMDDAGRASATVDPKTLVGLAQQMAAGLQYLHRHGVIHRDVKPENILKGSNGEIYLADFGVSEAFAAAADGTCSSGGGSGHGGEPAGPHHHGHERHLREHHHEHRIRGTKGTPAFLAPELLALRAGVDGAPGDGVDGEAVDVWALGITLYALLYGRIPWEFSNARDLFEAIQQRPIELRPAAAASRAVSPTSTAGTGPGLALRFPLPLLGGGGRAAAVGGSPGPTRHQSDVDSPKSDTAQAGIEGLLTLVEPSSVTAPPSLSLVALDLDLSLDNNGLSSSMGMALRSSPSMVHSFLDEAWRRLLHGMLQRDPAHRATLTDVRRQLLHIARRVDDATTAAAALRSPKRMSTVFTRLRTPRAFSRANDEDA